MSKEIVKKKEAPLPVTGDALMDQFSGAGMENITADDCIIPFLKIMQSGTKTEIEGSKEGDIFNTNTNEFFDKVNIIPVSIEKYWLRFESDQPGSGFLGRFDAGDPVFDTKGIAGSKDYVLTLPDGNILVYTMAFYVVYETPEGLFTASIPFQKSELKSAKKWLSALMSCQLPNGNVAPIFYRKWELGTTRVKNDSGKWMGFSRTLVGPIAEDEKLCDFVLKFYKSIKAGEVKVKHGAESDSEEEDEFE